MTVNGQVVAITGAARGIGRATAIRFARAGANVAIGDIGSDLAASVAQKIGANAIGLPLDVTQRDSVESFINEVEARLGPIDVFVNNAGIMPVGPLVAEDDATARRMIDINVHGTLHGMKRCFRA